MRNSLIMCSVLLLSSFSLSSPSFASSCGDNQWDKAIKLSKKAVKIKKNLLSKFKEEYSICDAENIHLNYIGKEGVLSAASDLRDLAEDFDRVTEAYLKSGEKWQSLSVRCDDRNARTAKEHSDMDLDSHIKYDNYSDKLLRCASKLEDFYKPSND